MKEKTNNKIITIIVCINLAIIILVVLLAIYNSLYSIDRISKLSLKMKECNNYIITTKSKRFLEKIQESNVEEEKENKITVKNGIAKCETKSKNNNIESSFIIWYTPDKTIMEQEKIVFLHSKGTNIYTNILNYATVLGKTLSSSYRYRFIKKSNINGKDCLVIEFKMIEDGADTVDKNVAFPNDFKNRYWIDIETGLIVKSETYGYDDELLEETTYEIETNTVEDNEMILPDIKQYDIIDYRNNN